METQDPEAGPPGFWEPGLAQGLVRVATRWKAFGVCEAQDRFRFGWEAGVSAVRQGTCRSASRWTWPLAIWDTWMSRAVHRALPFPKVILFVRRPFILHLGEEVKKIPPIHLHSEVRWEDQIGYPGMLASLWVGQLAHPSSFWLDIPSSLSPEVTWIAWIKEKPRIMYWREVHQFLCFGWEDLVGDCAGRLGFSNNFRFLSSPGK